MNTSWIPCNCVSFLHHLCIGCLRFSVCVCPVFVLRMYTYFVLLQCLVIIHVRITCPPAICQRFARIGAVPPPRSTVLRHFILILDSFRCFHHKFLRMRNQQRCASHACCDGCNLNLLNFFGLFLLWDIDLGSTVLCLWIIQCSYSVNMRRLTVTKIIPCHIVPQFRIASMPTQVPANLIVLNCSQRTRPPKRKDMPKTSSTFESTEPHAVSRDSISLVTWATGRWPCCQHTEPWY